MAADDLVIACLGRARAAPTLPTTLPPDLDRVVTLLVCVLAESGVVLEAPRVPVEKLTADRRQIEVEQARELRAVRCPKTAAGVQIDA